MENVAHAVHIRAFSDVFRYSVGRMDDVLILSSGEKTVPAPMEGIIGASPYVNSVVMFGRERKYVGILIEPRAGYEIDVDDKKQLAEFRNRVW